jgi:hypothetical protein
MTRSNPAVIPFPKRYEPLDCLDGPVCHFQAAELRVAMLHKLFSILARSEANTSTARELHEFCQGAREMLNDVVVLYRGSLAQAGRRTADD